jgi:hypothetical protein
MMASNRGWEVDTPRLARISTGQNLNVEGRPPAMRAFIASVLVSVVLAGGAAFYLVSVMTNGTVYQTYATSGARVGDPGNNLVGSGWRG